MITGKYIKKLRGEAGLSQIELAKLANVSQAHVAKIETEKVDPRLSTVNRILFVIRSKEKAMKCKDIMSKNIVSIGLNDTITKVVRLMRSLDISQIPVFQRGKQIGSIRETTIMKNLDKRVEILKVKDILDQPFPVVDSEDIIDILPSLLDFHPAVLVSVEGKIKGIITKSDLLEVK